MIKLHHHPSQQGFTLIEVMLVIVIMAVVASLIVMNIQGIDQRKTLQAREQLILNLQKIRRESLDQGRVFGLMILPAKDDVLAQYAVIEYIKKPQDPNQQNRQLYNATQNNEYIWQVAQDFKKQELPVQTHMMIEILDHQFNLDALKQSQQLPQVIWFGNGENIPVRIQLYMQQQPIGDAVELNRLGMVVKNES